MQELLGTQEDGEIQSGRIEFLDAFPETPTKLSLDIVNPQEEFQVHHRGQGTPLSFYTLGNGNGGKIPVKVAIRGIPGRATAEDVKEVWQWVKQALGSYGVGSRTAAGYGTIETSMVSKPDPGYSTKQLEFTLYSQGNAGPDTKTMELRSSHWRGWLRSWMLRFFLGVMEHGNAQLTVSELLGTLEPATQKGSVRLRMMPGKKWGQKSSNNPKFYIWQGKLDIVAPTQILNKVIIPILRIAVMVGGVGRGWRRPLHIFVMPNGKDASRGSYLRLMHTVKAKKEGAEAKRKAFGLSLKAEEWAKLYQSWIDFVQEKWPERFIQPVDLNTRAEVFSPHTCAVYVVPDPPEEPIDFQDVKWLVTTPTSTRGEGMNLIYKSKYKRKVDVGGNAAGGGNAHCSWVSIKRDRIPGSEDCQEVVCLFMGGEEPNSNHLRSQFLYDLANIPGAVHLFGVQPPQT